MSLIATINTMRADIERLKNKLNTIAKTIGVEDLDSEELREVEKLISDGNKIKAIKKYRLLTGVGVPEAKKFVDSRSYNSLNS